MNVQCSQCNRSAMYKTEEGHLLCLFCYEKLQNIWHQQQQQLAATLNYLAGEMEFVTGLPISMPRIQIPQRPVQYSPVNIQIDRSIVGAVNTGQIHQLDVAVTQSAESGNMELSEAIRDFTQAVVSDRQMEKATRDQILEQLSFLATQTIARPEQKKSSVARAVLENLTQIVSTLPGLMTLWEKLCPLFEAAFS